MASPGREAAVTFQDNAVEIPGGDPRDRRTSAAPIVGDLELALEIAPSNTWNGL